MFISIYCQCVDLWYIVDIMDISPPPPTPTLTPEIGLLMSVATSRIFHRMKNVDFVRLLLCSIVGLIILQGENETNNPDQWRMNTNLLWSLHVHKQAILINQNYPIIPQILSSKVKHRPMAGHENKLMCMK